MRCAKSQKLYNMATVPLQICNGTDKCCKSFIILYSLFFLLSLHFFFSLLSHPPVPSLFLRFPLSSPYTGSLSLWPVRDVHHQWRWRSSDDDSALRHPWSRSNHSISLQPLDLTHALATRSHPCSATFDLADLTLRPPLISRSSHSASLWLWAFLFYLFIFFVAIWVNLMVVVGCGLWAVTVAVVVGCGGDGPLLSVWIDGYLFVWIGAELVVVWHLGGGCAW